MSWGTCNGGSNNIHFGFPPIMNDGRNFAEWQPGAALNEQIKQEHKITSNWEYRDYLTKNAIDIMKHNYHSACNQCSACPPLYENQETKNTPYLYKSSEDKSQPFGYIDTDLKNLYLSREDLNSRISSPMINQEDYLQKGVQKHN
tara:strand:+ start:336 stop:770 length:435 start_codon:yes stop_codon:yes gene_type:complete